MIELNNWQRLELALTGIVTYEGAMYNMDKRCSTFDEALKISRKNELLIADCGSYYGLIALCK